MVRYRFSASDDFSYEWFEAVSLAVQFDDILDAGVLEGAAHASRLRLWLRSLIRGQNGGQLAVNFVARRHEMIGILVDPVGGMIAA